MSIDAMKQALSAIEFADMYIKEIVTGSTNRIVAENLLRESGKSLRAAIEQAHGDWDEVEALRASLREHMAEIHRLRAAIEQAQEPVAWVGPSWLNPETRTWESESFSPKPIKGWIPLYTAPRQWQGLTDEEIKIIWRGIDGSEGMLMRFARAIEAKLKERNT